MNIEVAETIVMEVSGKIRKIQLCFGDITKVNRNDKVDIIMVSAFPEDYAPTPRTVIGALDANLGLSVSQLAKDKAEDLRMHFHCWISKPLPSHLPYRRLLCFEQNDCSLAAESRDAVVGEVFRALLTTFSGEEQSVITPLLATGNQGSDKVKMLHAMVISCASWMRSGLPLSRLMIFIYCLEDRELVNEFRSLQRLLETRLTESLPSTTQDLLLIYVSQDKDIVDKFCKDIQGSRLTIRKLCADRESVITRYDNVKLITEMLQSQMVIAFLSPDYMKCGSALEAYNLGFCLGQKYGRKILYSVCCDDNRDIPTYMNSTEDKDFSLKSENSDDEMKTIGNYIQTIISDRHSAIPESNEKIAIAEVGKGSPTSDY